MPRHNMRSSESMQTKGSVSFLNENINVYKIIATLEQPLAFEVHVARLNKHVAKMYFFNSDSPKEQQQPIDAPTGVTLLDSNNEAVELVDNSYFLIVWFDSYQLQLNGITVLRFNQQKELAVFGSANAAANAAANAVPLS